MGDGGEADVGRVAAAAGVGTAPDSRPFAGHITLARVGDGRGVDLRPMTGVALAGRWTVREVSLVASHLGRRGAARYEVLESLPLRGRGACSNRCSELQ